MQRKWPERNRSCRRTYGTALSFRAVQLSVAGTRMTQIRRSTENFKNNCDDDDNQAMLNCPRILSYLKHEDRDCQRSHPRVQRIEIRNWR